MYAVDYFKVSATNKTREKTLSICWQLNRLRSKSLIISLMIRGLSLLAFYELPSLFINGEEIQS